MGSCGTLNRIQKVLAIFLKNSQLTAVTFFISLLFGALSYYGFASMMSSIDVPSDRLDNSSVSFKRNEKNQIVYTKIKFTNGLRWLNSLNKEIDFSPIVVSSLKNRKRKNGTRVKIRNNYKSNKNLAVIKYKKEKKKVKKTIVLTETKKIRRKARRKTDKKKKIKKNTYIYQPLEQSLGVDLVQ